MKKAKTKEIPTAFSRKAIWVTEKLHKKIKLLAAQKESSMMQIIEESMELWAHKHKVKI